MCLGIGVVVNGDAGLYTLYTPCNVGNRRFVAYWLQLSPGRGAFVFSHLLGEVGLLF